MLWPVLIVCVALNGLQFCTIGGTVKPVESTADCARVMPEVSRRTLALVEDEYPGASIVSRSPHCLTRALLP